MTQAQIERRYPELTGLSHETQLGILKKARQEAFTWKNLLLTTIIIGIVVGVAIVMIQQALQLPKGSVSGYIPGVVCGVAGVLYYVKTLRYKIRRLVQDEKQSNQ